MSAGRNLQVAMMALAVVVAASASHAQEVGLSGQRVRLTIDGRPPVVGVLAGSDASTLHVQPGDHGILKVERASVRELEVSRGQRRRTAEGLAGGVLAWGAFVGYLAAFDTLDESGVGEPWFITGVIAAGGAVGSLFKTEKWQRVEPRAVAFAVVPCRRGAGVRVAIAF